jgi:hypothetical protein
MVEVVIASAARTLIGSYTRLPSHSQGRFSDYRRWRPGEHEPSASLHLSAHRRENGRYASQRHEPLTLLAAVATRIPNVNIGTAVLLPAMRNPVLLAHQVATLDQIAEDRLILGVSIAADVPNIRAEFTAAGVPFEKRVGRLLEGLRLARALWSGQPVDWDERWKVERGTHTAPCRRPADLDRGIAAGEPGTGRTPFRWLAADCSGRAAMGTARSRSGGRKGQNLLPHQRCVTIPNRPPQ